MSESATPLQQLSGVLLAVAGAGFFAAGGLHPAGRPGQDFDQAIVSMLGSPMWPVAHWIAVVSALIAALALFLLIDQPEESRAAAAGLRLGVLAAVFMAVEFTIELAARADVARIASGQPAPLLALVDAMQAIGFPALAVAFILIATGTRWTPRWVTVLGVIGAVALAIGGFVVQGMHVAPLGPVFLVGNLLPIWMVWAGVTRARAAASRERR